MGGPSPEHDVSLKTGEIVLKHLDRKKYEATPVLIPKDAAWTLPSKTDMAFIAMHGAYGEDGTVQELLDIAGVPYTGSGVLASTLAMDKIKSGKLFADNGLNIPKFLAIDAHDWEHSAARIKERAEKEIGFPAVVKPSNGGSSVGVTIVQDPERMGNAVRLALAHGASAMVQEYIRGDEVTCAILDEGDDTEPAALPPTQIIPKASHFFDYEAKYTPGGSEEVTPPRMPTSTIQEIQSLAIRAHKILGCSGMSRTDMIVSDDKIFVLETNTIPGMTETSLYPQAAAAVGISFPELLDRIIRAALNRKIEK